MPTLLGSISVFVYALLLTGYMNRRRRVVHISLMACAFAIDMGMVLYIELARGALAQAQAKWGPLMVVHICLSLAVIVLYITQIVTGIRKARGQAPRWHAQTGISLLITRLGNLITSFLVT